MLYHSYRRDRISAISAVSVSPLQARLGLYVRFHYKNLTGIEVLDFLRYVLRHLSRPIVLLWDGGPIHCRKLVKDYIASNRGRLHVYRFPAYAPELNPAEYVWAQSKAYVANAAPKDIEELKDGLSAALARTANSQSLLRACLRQSGLFF